MPSYATVAEATAHPSFEPVVASDDRIAEVLDAVERRIEQATDVAWVPRTATDTLIGDDTDTLFVRELRPRSLTSVTIDGAEVDDLSDWKLLPDGRLVKPSGTFDEDAVVEVTYEHGHDAPPDDLVDVTIAAAAALLQQEANPRVGERTDSVVAEGQTINFANMPDNSRKRPFGMPRVDSVVMSYAAHRVVVG